MGETIKGSKFQLKDDERKKSPMKEEIDKGEEDRSKGDEWKKKSSTKKEIDESDDDWLKYDGRRKRSMKEG